MLVIDSFLMKGQPAFDKYSQIFNLIDISINTSVLRDFERKYDKFVLFVLVFSSIFENDTGQIFVSCNPNNANKLVLNGEKFKSLEIERYVAIE